MKWKERYTDNRGVIPLSCHCCSRFVGNHSLLWLDSIYYMGFKCTFLGTVAHSASPKIHLLALPRQSRKHPLIIFLNCRGPSWLGRLLARRVNLWHVISKVYSDSGPSHFIIVICMYSLYLFDWSFSLVFAKQLLRQFIRGHFSYWLTYLLTILPPKNSPKAKRPADSSVSAS